MSVRSTVGCGIVGLAALVAACSATPSEDVNTRPEASTLDPQAKAADGRMLNLSHFECTDDGKVNAHFVLLFAGKTDPGTLYVDSNQGSKTAESYKTSGNVWHYNVTFDAADIILYETTHVGSTPLHNVTSFAGGECGDGGPVCETPVTTGVRCASPTEVYGELGEHGISDPVRECDWLGLELAGKQETNLGSASQGAYVAIVKGGNGGDACPDGQSGNIYNIYTNVNAGDALVTGNQTGVSHITYCDCK
jgi:hypothetical protein